MQRKVAIAWKYQGTVTKERILHKLESYQQKQEGEITSLMKMHGEPGITCVVNRRKNYKK